VRANQDQWSLRANQNDDPFINARQEAGALAYVGAIIDVMIQIQYLGAPRDENGSIIGRVAFSLPETELILQEVIEPKEEGNDGSEE